MPAKQKGECNSATDSNSASKLWKFFVDVYIPKDGKQPCIIYSTIFNLTEKSCYRRRVNKIFTGAYINLTAVEVE